MADLPINEIKNLKSLNPLVDQKNLSVGDLELESDQAILSLRGALDITIDENSLARAKGLRDLFDQCIKLIENELNHPQNTKLRQKETNKGKSPFGAAFD